MRRVRTNEAMSSTGLDPLSLQTCRRLVVTIAMVIVWASVLSPQAVWAAVAAISGGCALVSAGLALVRREQLLGPTLSRWDETAALVGLHHLALLLI
jgi:hypothetical protein